MADVKTEQEPSIEEILESIRQIISEDAEEEKKPAPEVKLDLPKEPVIPPSNLSLTPKAQAPVPPSSLSLAQAPAAAPPPPPPAPPKPAAPAKPAESKPASPPPLDLTDKIAPVPLDLTPPSPPTIEMMDSPMTDQDKASSLMSPETASAVTDSLSKILASNVALERDISSPAGKVTLEEITRGLMKPIIKAWIDQHLPGIIDKAVQKEVEKLSRRVMDR
jgi:cell pole-organizing protein PopZ